MATPKKDKRTNNDLQNYTEKQCQDRVSRTPLITRDEGRCSGKVGSSYSTCDTRRATLVTNPVISHEWGKSILHKL